MQSRNSQWTYVMACLESENREIQGLKIWKHPWEEPGETAVVIDPIYSQTHYFGVYRMREGDQTVEFAAGEFSNGVWGFYVRNEPDASAPAGLLE